MKVGDLVRMKYVYVKPILNSHRAYTDQLGIVYEIAGRGIKVLMPDGKIKLGLTDYWKVI